MVMTLGTVKMAMEDYIPGRPQWIALGYIRQVVKAVEMGRYAPRLIL